MPKVSIDTSKKGAGKTHYTILHNKVIHPRPVFDKTVAAVLNCPTAGGLIRFLAGIMRDHAVRQSTCAGSRKLGDQATTTQFLLSPCEIGQEQPDCIVTMHNGQGQAIATFKQHAR